MNDHFGIRELAQDFEFDGIGDVVCLREGHVAIEFEMELNEGLHAGRPRSQVVNGLHTRVRNGYFANDLPLIVGMLPSGSSSRGSLTTS